MSLNTKVVWITGSGRGIGRAAARLLAQHGAAVVVSSRTQKEIDAVAEQIKKTGGRALAIRCDVTQKQQILNLVSLVKQQWGPIDVLINNAGVGIFGKITRMNEQDWDTLMNINLKSAFLCTQAVLNGMIERETGHIINIVSVAGRQPYYNCGGYCASKYGLMGFTDVLRMEVRKYNIKVTAYLPGATDTDIWGEANVDRSKMMRAEDVA
ncbi:SDR family oxidoreductase, partial [candidate division KSB1 bacterium]